ncbi:hypothetical protein NAV31_16390 [Pseudomonas stutzeri]|nr:hypothetical protein [Stutzerimonas degradans]
MWGEGLVSNWKGGLMACDVPTARYYGALVTNDSFKVLVRKSAESVGGIFFRWEHGEGDVPDLLVRSCLDKDFGISAEFVEVPDSIVFTKGGSLANFILNYTGGDIAAAGLEWVSLNTAWARVFELDDEKEMLSDSASLGTLDECIQKRRRILVEEVFDDEKKKWFGRFDRLCERVRSVLNRDFMCYGGAGVYSEYVRLSIRSAKMRLRKQSDLGSYFDSLYSGVAGSGRSAAREKKLVEVIHVNLFFAYRYLMNGEYAEHAARCREILGFLVELEKIYNGSSLEIRRRAIKGGRARWEGHDKAARVKADQAKADQIKRIEIVILKALENKKLYRKTDRSEVIAGKVAGVVLGEISMLGLGDVILEKDLKLYIWNFISENKAARDLMK